MAKRASVRLDFGSLPVAPPPRRAGREFAFPEIGSFPGWSAPPSTGARESTSRGLRRHARPPLPARSPRPPTNCRAGGSTTPFPTVPWRLSEARMDRRRPARPASARPLRRCSCGALAARRQPQARWPAGCGGDLHQHSARPGRPRGRSTRSSRAATASSQRRRSRPRSIYSRLRIGCRRCGCRRPPGSLPRDCIEISRSRGWLRTARGRFPGRGATLSTGTTPSPRPPRHDGPASGGPLPVPTQPPPAGGRIEEEPSSPRSSWHRELERLSLQLDGQPQEPWVELSRPAAQSVEGGSRCWSPCSTYEREMGGVWTRWPPRGTTGSSWSWWTTPPDGSRTGRARRSTPIADWPPPRRPSGQPPPPQRSQRRCVRAGALSCPRRRRPGACPAALGRLSEALESDPDAALAYGVAAHMGAEGHPLGLMNLSPWVAARLPVSDYIDAMAMIRPDAWAASAAMERICPLRLGGLRPLVPVGQVRVRGACVREMLAVYGSSCSGMTRSVSNSRPPTPTGGGRAAPKLMAGVEASR